MILKGVDRQILGELESDAGQNLSQLAKKLNISRQLMRYRFLLLQKKNIITGFYTIINFTLFGYTLYRTMIRLSQITAKKQAEIVSFLKNHPNVEWLVECGGRWDLIVNFMARNVIQYNQFMRELQECFPQQILHYDILTTVEIHDFGREYLIDKKRETRDIFYFGREYRFIKLDPLDIRILDLIAENARMSFAEMGKRLGVNPNPLVKRTKNMIKSGVIRGFKPVINLANTPYSAHKALIKFQNTTEKRKDEIADELKSDPNILAVLKLIGPWDFEVEFEVESKQKEQGLIRTIRDRYHDVINSLEVIPLYREHRFNFFPRDMIERTEPAKDGLIPNRPRTPSRRSPSWG